MPSASWADHESPRPPAPERSPSRNATTTDLQITSIETIRTERQPNIVWVAVRASDGTTGLGETWFGAPGIEEHIHRIAAPYLLGQDPALIRKHQQALMMLWSRKGVGVEARAASAIEIALWDLMGRATQQPLHQMLGGATRDRVPVYNTCVGPGYQRTALAIGNELFDDPVPGGRYEDYWATFERPGDLARDLLDEGISIMKILPFDSRLAYGDGDLIRLEELRRGTEILEAIRSAVGDRVEIAIECRGRWSVPSARRLAQAVEPYRPAWLEDPIRNENADALAEVRSVTCTPIAAGESIGIPFRHRELLAAEAVDIVLSDIAWNGGVAAARSVLDLAALHLKSAGLHDCTGPVTLAASTHLAMHHPSVFAQEIVRGYLDFYRDAASGLPTIENGEVLRSDEHGHGVTLRPDFVDNECTSLRSSADCQRQS